MLFYDIVTRRLSSFPTPTNKGGVMIASAKGKKNDAPDQNKEACHAGRMIKKLVLMKDFGQS